MKLKIYFLLAAIACLITLVLPAEAVYIPPQSTVLWAAPPMDCQNATPLNPGEYYLVDEYVYVYSSGTYYSTMNCALVYIGFDGDCESVQTTLSDYFFKRLPSIGGKYIKTGYNIGLVTSYSTYVPIT